MRGVVRGESTERLVTAPQSDVFDFILPDTKLYVTSFCWHCNVRVWENIVTALGGAMMKNVHMTPTLKFSEKYRICTDTQITYLVGGLVCGWTGDLDVDVCM